MDHAPSGRNDSTDMDRGWRWVNSQARRPNTTEGRPQRDPRGAHFEIKVDGIVRTHRDERDTAIEAARFLQQRNPGAKIVVTDLRTGFVIPHGRTA